MTLRQRFGQIFSLANLDFSNEDDNENDETKSQESEILYLKSRDLKSQNLKSDSEASVDLGQYLRISIADRLDHIKKSLENWSDTGKFSLRQIQDFASNVINRVHPKKDDHVPGQGPEAGEQDPDAESEEYVYHYPPFEVLASHRMPVRRHASLRSNLSSLTHRSFGSIRRRRPESSKPELISIFEFDYERLKTPDLGVRIPSGSLRQPDEQSESGVPSLKPYCVSLADTEKKPAKSSPQHLKPFKETEPPNMGPKEWWSLGRSRRHQYYAAIYDPEPRADERSYKSGSGDTQRQASGSSSEESAITVQNLLTGTTVSKSRNKPFHKVESELEKECAAVAEQISPASSDYSQYDTESDDEKDEGSLKLERTHRSTYDQEKEGEREQSPAVAQQISQDWEHIFRAPTPDSPSHDVDNRTPELEGEMASKEGPQQQNLRSTSSSSKPVNQTPPALWRRKNFLASTKPRYRRVRSSAASSMREVQDNGTTSPHGDHESKEETSLRNVSTGSASSSDDTMCSELSYTESLMEMEQEFQQSCAMAEELRCAREVEEATEIKVLPKPSQSPVGDRNPSVPTEPFPFYSESVATLQAYKKNNSTTSPGTTYSAPLILPVPPRPSSKTSERPTPLALASVRRLISSPELVAQSPSPAPPAPPPSPPSKPPPAPKAAGQISAAPKSPQIQASSPLSSGLSPGSPLPRLDNRRSRVPRKSPTQWQPIKSDRWCCAASQK